MRLENGMMQRRTMNGISARSRRRANVAKIAQIRAVAVSGDIRVVP